MINDIMSMSLTQTIIINEAGGFVVVGAAVVPPHPDFSGSNCCSFTSCSSCFFRQVTAPNYSNVATSNCFPVIQYL